MQPDMQQLIANLNKRNIQGVFCENRDQVHSKLLELVPTDASVGFSGSQTLEQLEVVEMLQSRGNKVFDQYDSSLSREESVRVRKLGSQADFYLVSANALARTGELVFFSAYGHRIAGIADARNLVVICGINKIVQDLPAALKRAREYATPLNCKRLKWDTPCAKDGVCHQEVCYYPEYTRMCCQVLTVEAEMNPDRITVILVNESLGY